MYALLFPWNDVGTRKHIQQLALRVVNIEPWVRIISTGRFLIILAESSCKKVSAIESF